MFIKQNKRIPHQPQELQIQDKNSSRGNKERKRKETNHNNFFNMNLFLLDVAFNARSENLPSISTIDSRIKPQPSD
uniref:Uncharacterized protein n=1 Tax=Noccaea caerulescens TaxID=107243 RepID=A0A1J3IY21_NOCCA